MINMQMKLYQLLFFILVFLGSLVVNGQELPGGSKTSFQFGFGSGSIKSGYTQVAASDSYSVSAGYGFDFGTNPGLTPFYFSIKVPEGNYQVTLTLGDKTQPTEATVKAESRRLMLEDVHTAKGKFVTKTFIVNIKDRNIKGGGHVSLKPRELNKLDWDDKLTLEFDLKPVIKAITIKKVDDQVTVFLAGNSTVVNQDEEPWASWGQMIPRFFKPGVVIANHAESGLSLGSFIGSKRLEKVLSIIKPGDYVFVEFGHNDEKEKGPDDGPYKSYTERLHLFAREVKNKGGHLVILTPTARRTFNAEGKMENSHGDYPDAARKVAQEEGLPLIDLTALSTRFYEAMGAEGSKKAFVIYPELNLNDNTHFNPYGAYELAKIIVQGIKDQLPGLAKYLVDIPVFDPAKPDPFDSFSWPKSPGASFLKPDGN